MHELFWTLRLYHSKSVLKSVLVLMFSFWQITLICLNDKQTKFITLGMHQTKLNFNLYIDFQTKLDEVIIKFVNQLASTSKLLDYQGC